MIFKTLISKNWIYHYIKIHLKIHFKKHFKKSNLSNQLMKEQLRKICIQYMKKMKKIINRKIWLIHKIFTLKKRLNLIMQNHKMCKILLSRLTKYLKNNFLFQILKKIRRVKTHQVQLSKQIQTLRILKKSNKLDSRRDKYQNSVYWLW